MFGGIGHTDAMGEESQIRYDVRGHMPVWVRWLVGVQTVMSGAVAVVSWWSYGWGPFVAFHLLAFLCILAVAALFAVPMWLVVDEIGVKRPFHRVIPWSQFDSVVKPGRWDDVLRIRRRDGGTMSLPLPVSYAEQVARIGGLPLPAHDEPAAPGSRVPDGDDA